MVKILKLIKTHKYILILLLPTLIYAIYFTVASFLRYDNYYTGRFDLGNMDQVVWNTLHGRFFQTSSEDGGPISRLAIHADFLLILLSPFYLVWESPKMLLLIQTITLSSGAIFVYLLGKDVLKNKIISFVLAFSFLLYPAMQFSNLFDFHAVTLATTFLLAAFYFLRKNNYIWFSIFLLLACLTKEQIWTISALFGLYIAISKQSKAKILGLTIFLGSLVIFYYLVWHAIPQALGRQHFALSYYSDFGDSPTQILKNILFSPQKIMLELLEPDRLHYLWQLLFPLGFLSLLSPFYLFFSLPDLLVNLLSNNSQLHQIYYHYTATITPFIFISAIFGLKKIAKWFPKIPTAYFIFYLLISTFIAHYSFGALPFSKEANISMFTKPQKDKAIIDAYLARIFQHLSVSATNNLGSHLSHRQKISTVPFGMDTADLVLFLFTDSWAQPSLKEQRQMAEKVRSNKNYKEVFHHGDFLVFEKKMQN